MNWSWHNTDKFKFCYYWLTFTGGIALSLNLEYNCRISVPSYEKLTWNLIHEMVLTYYLTDFNTCYCLSWNLVFWTCLCCLIKYWFEIWYMNWLDIIKIKFEFRHSLPTLKNPSKVKFPHTLKTRSRHSFFYSFPIPCFCSDSEFFYAPCGHIVTGDLNYRT